MITLDDKRITVTGGAGFLGSHLVERLKEKNPRNIFVPRSRNYDLRNKDDIIDMYLDSNPDIVIHLAATVGGIGANKDNPGKFFYDNAIMGIQLMEYARKFDIDKFVALGTVCSYPKNTPVPFKEENLWNGYPEETNAPYGLAKKMLLEQSKAYRKQYNFNSIFLLPVNLYGPRDNFDLKTSHVIPAIIKKCVNAKRNNKRYITAWGDGSPTREFLYVKDAVEGILLATENYSKGEPINLGSGYEMSIKDLVNLICDIVGFDGKVRWDTSKPNGQPRRKLDTGKAKEEFGFEAGMNFENGLKETIKWYD